VSAVLASALASFTLAVAADAQLSAIPPEVLTKVRALGLSPWNG
jgi:hypothetical protein